MIPFEAAARTRQLVRPLRLVKEVQARTRSARMSDERATNGLDLWKVLP